MNLATQVIFDGVPTYPDAGRCWQIVDKYQVGEPAVRGWVGGSRGEGPVSRKTVARVVEELSAAMACTSWCPHWASIGQNFDALP
jgi:hypothetical protein